MDDEDDIASGAHPRALERLRSLYALSSAALRDHSRERIAAGVIEALRDQLDVPVAGYFALRAGEPPSLVLAAGSGWAGGDVIAVADGEADLLHASPGRPRFVRPDGTTVEGLRWSASVPVVADARPAGIVAVGGAVEGSEPAADDIALMASLADILGAALARIWSEEALKSSEQRLALAQRIAHMGSYDWHISTDTNVWSDELYRIYGSEPGSFNASYERFLSFIHPDDRERIKAIHQRAYETREPYEMEERIVRPDGQERILASNGEVITDADGVPVRMVGICFDVTEQRRAEEEARLYRESELARGQALEINDNIVQGLSTIVCALGAGRGDMAAAAAEHTLGSARSMMDDLLGRAHADALKAGALVRSHAPASALRGEPAGARTSSLASVRVVVADDADDMRAMLRMILLGDDAIEVVGEARDGVETLERVHELKPDVLLLDLSMPRMDGLQVLEQLGAREGKVKVIVLSGFDHARMRPLALARGATSYLEKGAAVRDLAEIIRDVSGLPPAERAGLEAESA